MHDAEEAFIQEILTAATDADAARLVYADWLEERGDARAEFIRMEHEAAQLHPASERYWELKPRRRELRAKIDEAWLHRLGYEVVYRPLFTRLPETRRERWRLVEEFIEYWHPRPLGPESGNTEEELLVAEQRLGFRLPTALREWFALAGRRADIWSRQDRLLDLDRLTWDAEANVLPFRWENQGCECWGIATQDLSLDDPPVQRTENPGEDSPTVTAFAIQQLLLESMWSSNLPRLNHGGGLGFDEVREHFTPCELPNTYWVLNPVYFYEGRDIYFVLCEADGFLYAVAKNEATLQHLPSSLQSVLVEP